MRFTVKAKLASAFGAVIILSIITGVVAHAKLSSLDTGQQTLVTQSERMKEAADLMNEVQGQLRSELRMILPTSDKDTADNQQNAGASEQVSSTSEELASQAEQLQSTIAYFKIEQSSSHDRAGRQPAALDKAVAQLRSKANTMSAMDRGGKKPVAPARPARALKVASGGGFALAMDDGTDVHDAEFQR